MANEDHIEILKQGVEIWNRWRTDNPGIKPDLAGADLIGVDLTLANLIASNLERANLRTANLTRADLTRANLEWADLMWADLRWANLSGANLTKAYFRLAALSGANLSEAFLHWTEFNGAELRGADLNGTILWETIFANVDLAEIKGLENVEHYGPSTIGIDTIYQSRGKIPEVFLRGVGIPDNFIEYMPSLIGEAVQFYSCFISYSTKDQEFAERLHADLQSQGVRCWFAPEDIKGGRKLHEQIPEAIRLYDKLLLVLSENSMNSEWVKTEIYHARQDEIRTGKRKLFPIGLIDFEEIRKWEAFDADVGKDMAREVREYYIPDFSNWKNHDSYKKAFDRLLRDLRAEN
jgi:uncharacterized protein YjbI with pentapeptide repeats